MFHVEHLTAYLSVPLATFSLLRTVAPYFARSFKNTNT